MRSATVPRWSTSAPLTIMPTDALVSRQPSCLMASHTVRLTRKHITAELITDPTDNLDS